MLWIRNLCIFSVGAICCLSFMSCGGSNGSSPSGEADGNRDTGKFEWNGQVNYPEERENVPIEWFGTYQESEVIDQATQSGKRIFCYLSKYDAYGTADIEAQVLSHDGWGPVINSVFIPWEVNVWEDPALAYKISRGAGMRVLRRPLDFPSIAILDVDDNGELQAVDAWDAIIAIYFPTHGYEGQGSVDSSSLKVHPGSTEGDENIERLKTDDAVPLGFERNWMAGFSSGYSGLRSSALSERNQVMDWGNADPELCLWLGLEELESGKEPEELKTAVQGWCEDVSIGLSDVVMLDNSSLGMPDDLYGSFMTISPYRNLQIIKCCSFMDADYPADPVEIFHRLYGLVAGEDGKLTGGFPAYLDTMAALMTDTGDIPWSVLINPGSDKFEAAMNPPALPSQQNIPWINAQLLSLWLDIVYSDEELGIIQMPDGSSAREFVTDLAMTMLDDLEENSGMGDPGSMRLMDKMWMMSLYNQLYQIMGEREYLQWTRDIVLTFPPNSFEQWFDPNSGILMGELVKQLHYYFVATGEQDVRDTIDLLREYAPSFLGGMMGGMQQLALLDGIEISQAHSINIVIIGNVDDNLAGEMLREAHLNWDPRRVIQLLQPDTDSDLIAAKGLQAASNTIAYVCINGNCGERIDTVSGLVAAIGNAIIEIQDDYLL